MIQEIITGLIILTASAVAAYRIYQVFTAKPEHRSGCGSACTSCKLGEEIREAKKRKQPGQFVSKVR